MKTMLNVRLLLLLLLLFCNASFAQQAEQDSTKKVKSFKNTVRFNLTNPLLLGFKSIILGYERTVGDHQSFSINVGQNSLPKVALFDLSAISSVVQAQKTTEDKGYNVSFDYRFYLSKENKY